MYQWFAILSLAVLVSFEATVMWDSRREWKGWQRAFETLEGSLPLANGTAKGKGDSGGRTKRRPDRNGAYEIRQIVLDPLGRIDRCPTCHLGIDRSELAGVRQPFRSHPGPFLSQHPPERFGCTSCHRGQGMATRALAAHGRVEDWPEPLWTALYVQASCEKCHPISLLREPVFLQGRKLFSRYNDLEGAPLLSEGRKLFQERGCWACHKVEGYRGLEKLGPPLSRIREKVRPAWLLQWLKDPRAYLPRTIMPNFGLNQQQAMALTSYLLTLESATPSVTPSALPYPGSASLKTVAGGAASIEIQGKPRLENEPSGAHLDEAASERGSQIFRRSRCVSCHSLDGRGGLLGPALDQIGDKVNRAWLIRWIYDPRSYYPSSHMPRFRFSQEEREDLVGYLLGKRSGEESTREEELINMARKDRELIREGRRLVKELGCFGCHEIPGFDRETEVGPELTRFGGKRVEELDFGKLAGKIGFTPQAWTLKKLQAPRVFRGTLKMPDSPLSTEEAGALSVYLVSLTGEQVPAAYLHRKKGRSSEELPPQGAFGRLLRDLRCFTCHSIGEKGGDLAPALSIEGSQVTEEWLSEFFRRPNFLRPILTARMPVFNLSPGEIRTLAEYMRVVLVDDKVDQDLDGTLEGGKERSRMSGEGAQMYERLGCRGCHQVGLSGGSIGPEMTRVGARLKEGWIFQWLKSPQRYRPRSLQPDYGLSDHEARALAVYLANLKQ